MNLDSEQLYELRMEFARRFGEDMQDEAIYNQWLAELNDTPVFLTVPDDDIPTPPDPVDWDYLYRWAA